MGLSKAKRAELFAMFGGRCAYCGHELPLNGWHADHIEPVFREWWKGKPYTRWERVDGRLVSVEEKQPVGMRRPENDREDNFFPSCQPCNIDKSCSSIEDWRACLERTPEVMRRNHSAWRHAERFGIVAVVQPKVKFYFEKLAAVPEYRET